MSIQVFPKLGGIRWQLIIGSSMILIGVFTAAGLGVRQLTSSTLYGTIDRELSTRADRTAARLQRGEPADRAPRGPAPNRGNPYKPVVVMLDGTAPPGGDTLLAWDQRAVNMTAAKPVQTTRVIAYDEPFRILTVAFRQSGNVVGAIQVPYPIADIERSVQAVDRTLLMLSPVVLLIACAIAFWITRRVLQPVEQMTAAAERIGASTLSERLPVIGTDEFAALASTFNGLLSRLELAFAQKKRFVADASHELRTPLTRIKGVAGVALLGDQNPDALSDALRVVEGAADAMAQLVDGLLVLARGDAGNLGTQKVLMRADELAAHALSQLVIPGDISVDVRIAPLDAQLYGNESDLLRVVVNLISNAVRYTPAGGVITLAMTESTITVRDTGCGVSNEHLSRLGERFYRVDDARARSGPGDNGGTGLGLAICTSIVAAHGGTMRLLSEPGQGMEVMIHLPEGPPAAEIAS
jgi:signal transduction histidine kinase